MDRIEATKPRRKTQSLLARSARYHHKPSRAKILAC